MFLVLDQYLSMLTFLDESFTVAQHEIEIARSMREHVWLDLQKLQIFKNDLLEVDLLFGRICVIESHDQLAFERLLIVLIQQSCLSVT